MMFSRPVTKDDEALLPLKSRKENREVRGESWISPLSGEVLHDTRSSSDVPLIEVADFYINIREKSTAFYPQLLPMCRPVAEKMYEMLEELKDLLKRSSRGLKIEDEAMAPDVRTSIKQ